MDDFILLGPGGYFVLFFLHHLVPYLLPQCSILTTRELLSVLKTFVCEDYLPKHNIVLKHFHSGGGSEFFAKEVLQYLHRNSINTSHFPRDTLEMNSVSERCTRTI